MGSQLVQRTAHGRYCAVKSANWRTVMPATEVAGFDTGVKAFKPTSSFGASLLEAPPIPQFELTTPALDAAPAAVSPPAGTIGTNGVSAPGGVGLGAGLDGVTSSATGSGIGTSGAATGFGTGLSSVSSPTTGVRTAGLGGSFGLSSQPTSSPTACTGLGGLTALNVGSSSSIGVGLSPQARGFGLGLGAANPPLTSMSRSPPTGIPPILERAHVWPDSLPSGQTHLASYSDDELNSINTSSCKLWKENIFSPRTMHGRTFWLPTCAPSR